MEKVRGTSAFNPSHTEGQSIMDMDTNEITIDRIVGFPWNDPGTDLGRRATDAGFVTGSVRYTCGHGRRVGRAKGIQRYV